MRDPSASYAAAAAAVFGPSASGQRAAILHLARRATFGPRPADLSDIERLGVDGWIRWQLDPASIADPEGDRAWNAFPLAGAHAPKIHASIPMYAWDAMFATGQATLARQIFTRRQLVEVVVDVMADHLHVAVPSDYWDTVPSFGTDVIRPFALRRYRDMLLAAMRHPGMLQYLNNDVSSKTLVNENLGRELLELHTIGLGGGYTEDDVVPSAKVLTGRTVVDGKFVYDPDLHWVGPLTVMGWSSSNHRAADGLAVGDSYLRYLAGHPSTARTVSRKLAVRFVGDDPPQALVDRMARAYLAHDTALWAPLHEMFASRDFWASAGQKVRRPLEDLVGTARVLDLQRGDDTVGAVTTYYWTLWTDGHAPLAWAPPNGYPDIAAAWTNAGSLVARMTVHRALVNGWWAGLRGRAPEHLVPVTHGMTAGEWVDAVSRRLLGETLTPARRDAVVRLAGVAPSAPAAGATGQAWQLVPLLLDSSSFQQR